MAEVDSWAARLGYDRISGSFIRGLEQCPLDHPFASEIRAILQRGAASALQPAIYCIDQVPTICLIEEAALSNVPEVRRTSIRELCERLWNQNLARAVLVASPQKLQAWSVDNPAIAPEIINKADAAAVGAWSAKGLISGEVLRGRDAWFDPERRVDKTLLDNVTALVESLKAAKLAAAFARELTANVIFVAYLEDRGIVSDEYQARRKVRSLYDLLGERDIAGLEKLFQALRDDLNGDFLRPIAATQMWRRLPRTAFSLLHKFLCNTVLRTGQLNLWRYDFSQIPIELIAGIYETFLASKASDESNASGRAKGRPQANTPVNTKRRLGAYYTPRMLADWVIDTAFEGRNSLDQRVFDGACGSGMLLTAAFRYMVRTQEAHANRIGNEDERGFAARCLLLKRSIFGADIDEDACRLTAFSLYLALLEDLTPRDLAVLRRGGHKLPALTDNIRAGESGDFFSKGAAAAANGRFTVFISNPPWKELSSEDPATRSVEEWRSRQLGPKPHIAGHQIATAFALGAADCLEPQGRAVLILPVNPFVSAERTRRLFRADLLGRYKVERIANFSDMRRLIFADAVHPFVVFAGTARQQAERYKSISSDTFEYWTPKTDIALAFGRFAIHGADRTVLPASALIDETPHLQLRYWGSEQDIVLLRKLWGHGRIADLFGEGSKWEKGKGFHLKDEDRRRSRSTWYTEVPEWMKRRRFLRATRLPSDIPIVERGSLESFEFESIARIVARRFFEGPRVIWPDGTHPENGIKAVFADQPFTFQHSLGVLSAPNDIEGRLIARFLVTYMRSPLGTWLSLLLSNSVASERPKLHITELLEWPFWAPANHPDAAKAKRILKDVDKLLTRIEEADQLIRPHKYSQLKDALDDLVFQYFGLEDEERVLVKELAEYVGPSLQPTSLRFQALMKPLRTPPSRDQLVAYCARLQSVLERWKSATRGSGSVQVAPWTAKSVPLGAAVLEFLPSNTRSQHRSEIRLDDDEIVSELVETLKRVTAQSDTSLLAIPNITLVDGRRIVIIKPLVVRFWLQRSAIEDATRVAREIQAVEHARLRA